ncbi:DUF302 domain-containing protein [Aureimonas fodinaquatilis]|uniref:DUF302 domain-containing protein n=1 Tax=Aureimonas fodinaquatilis TaxID=2565783 RepID=A0A5B0DTI6_9HYPH|nr:DUF302 domain-containing protein [Aureimonas fodinaquatilis]KAA0969743.1 DUF302 domain-containing protein [Aureimonas fodinaquatilis]
MIPRLLLPLLGFAFLLLSAGHTAWAADDWVVRQSRYDVEETSKRLEEVIERSGSVVLGVIDHEAAARLVGEELSQMRVVMFSKPKISTPLMRQNKRLGIDLPQRILIWDEEGATQIGYVDPGVLAQRYGLSAQDREWQEMRSSLDALTQAAISRTDRR